jgi:hypothetical protein
MLDCSSCTRPPCLAMVADMLKTYKTLVVAAKSEIWQLPRLYMTLWPPLTSLTHDWFTLRDAYHAFHLRKSWNICQHDTRFRRQCEQMPWSTMAISHYGQRYIGHIALCLQWLLYILIVNRHLHRYGVTQHRLHVASYSCSVQFYLPFLNVPPESYCRWLQWKCHGELTGFCIAGVSQLVVHWMKPLSFCLVQIQSHLAEVFVKK